ncbi:reverse transcriptase domain-containing protein [Alkalihalophilus marmarensis]|uniref:reverse transcriptase domain-containing protein n=1 Tax=Alkalihalophilus marmarensis TaxID=521377 RepID=UPI0009FA417C
MININLKQFFNTINHNKLINLISKTIQNKNIISLIHKFLINNIQINKNYKKTIINTPQKKNLSPLLNNIILNKLNTKLKNHKLHFIHYTNNYIIIIKNKITTKQIIKSITKFIKKKLNLIINTTKTKITKPNNPNIKFLKFNFFKNPQIKIYKTKPHQKSINNFKFKLKQLTKKN